MIQLPSKSNLLIAWPGELFCLLAGMLLTLSFAPFNIFPLGIIAPAILFTCWLPVSTKRAYWRGLLFGIGFFATGVSWVYISIYHYGNAPEWLAGLITALFIFILALFPAINGYLLKRFFSATPLLIFPALWVLLEWVRSWIFTGFPWLLLGYSQITSPLRGYAPLFSVYGVSLAALLSSVLLVSAVTYFRQSHFKKMYTAVLSIIFIWVLGGILNMITWTTPKETPIQASLIQGNIQQEIKWVPEHAESTLDAYENLTQQHWGSQLIAWPEAAIPLTLQDAEDFVNYMAIQAKQHNAAIITGIPVKAPLKQGYYNAIIAVGNGDGFYIKSHLVPFGEFTPLEQQLGKLLTFFDIPMSNMVTEAKAAALLTVNKLKIAAFICYEIAFPEEVRNRDSEADILLTVTDDAWFGHSIAQAQHLEMARMRSLEMGRSSLFVSNNGITAFITAKGNIQSAAPPYQEYVLTDTIQPMQGETPWQRFGMDPVLSIIGMILLVAFVINKKSGPYGAQRNTGI